MSLRKKPGTKGTGAQVIMSEMMVSKSPPNTTAFVRGDVLRAAGGSPFDLTREKTRARPDTLFGPRSEG
jgi:hypothetical protein